MELTPLHLYNVHTVNIIKYTITEDKFLLNLSRNYEASASEFLDLRDVSPISHDHRSYRGARIENVKYKNVHYY